MRATARRTRDNLWRRLSGPCEIDIASHSTGPVSPRPYLVASCRGECSRLCRMRVLIVNVRPVSKIVFDAIACDIAPRAAGVTLDVRVIVSCSYECRLVAKRCRTGVRREASSHRRPHESGSHYDNEHRSHWLISLFEWTHSNSPRNNRLGLLFEDSLPFGSRISLCLSDTPRCIASVAEVQLRSSMGRHS
jgi:hypothetical protein